MLGDHDMATTPIPTLTFIESCRDCGVRTVELPKPLPNIGDDFDWLVRDYDGFRLFMMEELAARFAERKRWTPADIEVIFVEALAVVLDQMSDTLDRVHTEAYLDSARSPESVFALLKFIGYETLRAHYDVKWSDDTLITHLISTAGHNASSLSFIPNLTISSNIKKLLLFLGHDENLLGLQPNIQNIDTAIQLLDLIGYNASSLEEALDLALPVHRNFAIQQLFKQWRNNPYSMDAARQAGPKSIHVNHRMVTQDDYRERTEDHPLVLRAACTQNWTGSWVTLKLTVILAGNLMLDQPLTAQLGGKELLSLQRDIDRFHWRNSLQPMDWDIDPSCRGIIRPRLDHLRMVGQEVWLQDVIPVGISIALSIRIQANYYRSEIQQAVDRALSTDADGFFAPGRLAFGETLYASDIIEWLMNIEGIDTICLNRFKRIGKNYSDQSGSGVIRLDSDEIARCDNDSKAPVYGYWRLNLHGGIRG